MTITQIPIWLDCDPGHDDMIAILLSAFNPNFKLLGISTTFGNSSLENTTRNTLSILTIFNQLQIPVYKGSGRPLVKQPSYAPSIHGKSGLAGTELPVSKIDIQNPNDDNLEKFHSTLASLVEQYDGELSIVATGPLTNIGLFFKSYPDLKTKVKFISVMGGGIHISNWGAGEFNTWCDPHGANLIFQDPVLAPKTILLPIDVTHTAILTKSIEEKLAGQGELTPLRKFLIELMEFFKKTYSEQVEFSVGPPVHDPLAVVVLLERYGVEDMGIKSVRYALKATEEGELDGKLDFKEDPNGVEVVMGLDVDKFWGIVLDSVKIADN